MRYNTSSKIMLQKADGSYRSAMTDLDNGIYDRAISSLYYSAFQSVTALMLLRNIRSKSHSHVRSFVNNQLVRPGYLEIELGKMYNKLMDMRGDADYSDIITFTKNEVLELCKQVKRFNLTIVQIIESDPNSTNN